MKQYLFKPKYSLFFTFTIMLGAFIMSDYGFFPMAIFVMPMMLINSYFGKEESS